MLRQIILALCCLIPLLRGWPTGAGDEACINFTPSHTGSTGQTVSPPYTLTVSASSIAPGATVTVTLTATETNGTFKGFLVQARCANCTTSDTAIVPGTFAQAASTDPTKTKDCSSGNKNSMTHANNATKTAVSFTWTAPATVDMNQRIEFRGAVVKSFSEWWPNVRSSPLVYVSTGHFSTPVSELVLAVIATMVTLAF